MNGKKGKIDEKHCKVHREGNVLNPLRMITSIVNLLKKREVL
jgi:hypothetical protein